MEKITKIDLSSYDSSTKQILKAFHDTGILLIKDPTIDMNKNEKFIELMEKYFYLPNEIKEQHVHKELHYQVGLTPEFIEMPRDHCEIIHRLPKEHIAQKPKEKDPKQRWFHRLTPVDPNTEFPTITGKNVIPKELPEWENIINDLGNCFMKVFNKLLKYLAEELNLDENYFQDLCEQGNHMIAPTFSDLSKYNKENTILAGFHSDISFLTIHGKSKFSGLNIWTRDNERITVIVPDGYFLVQSGKQLQYITGGYILAGFHEVVVNDKTIKQIQLAKENNKPLVRVSSTFFGHINSDKYMEVLEQFRNDETVEIYPKVKEGYWLRNRLKKLMN